MTTQDELADWIERGQQLHSVQGSRVGPLGLAVFGMPKPPPEDDREISLPQDWRTGFAALLDIPPSLAEQLHALHKTGKSTKEIVGILRNRSL